MNILILNWKDRKHPKAGGAEFVTEAAAQAWVKTGHSVTLFCASVAGQPERETVDGVKIIRRGSRFSVYWQAYRYWKTEGWKIHELVIDEINTVPFFTPLYVRDAKIVALIHQLCREFWDFEVPFPFSWLGRYVLEDLWLETKGRRYLFYKGLIQLAGAFVHLQKSRPDPASRLFRLCLKNFESCDPVMEGLDLLELVARVQGWLALLETSGFASIPYNPEDPPRITLQAVP